MTTLITAWVMGFVSGWLAGLTCAKQGRPPQVIYGLPPLYDWRRRINHENHSPPTGPPPLLRQPRAPLQRREPNPPPREP
jgi:hypothetical protein